MFAYATEEGWLERNPAGRLEVPEVVVASVERVWTVTEVRRFLEATSQTPLGLLWWLLAVTGMRRGEALGLRWDDVTLPDIGAPFIEIRRQYRQVDGRPEYAAMKTARSARRFTIDPDTAERLLASREAQRQSSGADWQSGFPVFMRPDLLPFRPDYVSRKFQQQARALGLLPIDPHGLRHSLADAGRCRHATAHSVETVGPLINQGPPTFTRMSSLKLRGRRWRWPPGNSAGVHSSCIV